MTARSSAIAIAASLVIAPRAPVPWTPRQPWASPHRYGRGPVHHRAEGWAERRTLPSASAAFSGLASTHLALSDSVRFPGDRDRRLSVLTLLADWPCVKWQA